MVQQLIEDHRREMQRMRNLNADMAGIITRIKRMLELGELVFYTETTEPADDLMEAIQDVMDRATDPEA